MGLIIVLGMTVGLLFLNEVNKHLGNIGQSGPFLFMALMFMWDGIIIYTINDYASKKELAIGIMIGTLIKCFLLLKYASKYNKI